jgi:D-proline reductase (dithiol) PrdB
MRVDSFKYTSRLVSRYYKMTQVKPELPIPWTPLTRPLADSRFCLVTSGGLYHRGQNPPFDVERERREPAWGDPSFRCLPSDIDPADVGLSHLHLRADDVLADMNILLPIQRFQELAAGGRIGGLADHVYSFMGYQGFPSDLTGWRERYGPEVARRMAEEEVDCVLLTSA